MSILRWFTRSILLWNDLWREREWRRKKRKSKKKSNKYDKHFNLKIKSPKRYLAYRSSHPKLNKKKYSITITDTSFIRDLSLVLGNFKIIMDLRFRRALLEIIFKSTPWAIYSLQFGLRRDPSESSHAKQDPSPLFRQF